jgi:prepilin-type N-terminal cleavage/methylation domain-containing protein
MKRARHQHRRRNQGMTIIELMIVIVILSVLTSLGISGYQKLVYQARNTEAYQLLGAIRAAQHSNYQVFGQYVGNENWAEWPQGAFPAEKPVLWGDQPADPVWQQLNVNPGGPVWFKYRIRASADPQRAPANVFRPLPNGPWFQAQARGDFNADGEFSLFEITSTRSKVFVENLND